MKPQLLAPAGNLEKLKYAVSYGADAIYFGAEFGSLRTFAGNFSMEDAEKGLNLLHKQGKKGYVALNIYPFSDEYDRLIDTAKKLDSLGADAFIISDIGVLGELGRLKLNADLHISTQANLTSAQTALAYKQLGAKRVNLARELSFERIKEIQQAVDGQIETEVFIHGSVCFSYSGRCAISDYLAGHRANQGSCKHPCRWSYNLVEEKRPNQFMPVFEDQRGTYLFNSKELALFSFVPALADAGIASFKIEGRMKSVHYVAAIVSFYRQVVDGVRFTEQKAMELLNRVPNRGYSTGFMKGGVGPDDYEFDQSCSQASSIFVASVTEQKKDGKTVLEIKNKIHAGETLEVLNCDGSLSEITLPQPLVTTKGEQLDFANNSQFIILPTDLPAYTILRRVNG